MTNTDEWLKVESLDLEAQGVAHNSEGKVVFIEDALCNLRQRFPEALALAYGHVGDGNVHLNVIPPPALPAEEMEALFRGAEAVIFSVVDRLGGSISAEHGIGLVKQRAYLERVDSVSLDLATRLKNALDPNGILSKGRIFPIGAR